jgi:hypothetical protein
MSDLKQAVARLERAYIAGLDEEFRDDVRTVLDALAARQPVGVDQRTTIMHSTIIDAGISAYHNWPGLSEAILVKEIYEAMYSASKQIDAKLHTAAVGRGDA